MKNKKKFQKKKKNLKISEKTDKIKLIVKNKLTFK